MKVGAILANSFRRKLAPTEPVARAANRAAAAGKASPNRPMVMRPAGVPAMETSRKALEVTAAEEGQREGRADEMEEEGRKERDRERARARRRDMIGGKGGGGGGGGGGVEGRRG